MDKHVPWLPLLLITAVQSLLFLTGCSEADVNGNGDGPTVMLTWPPQNAIIGSTLEIQVISSEDSVFAEVNGHTVALEFVDGHHIGTWQGTDALLAQSIPIYAWAEDEQGNPTATDSLHVTYRFKQIANDPEEGSGQDIARLYARNTRDAWEFRVEFHSPLSTVPEPIIPPLNLGLFIDSDMDASTGLNEAEAVDSDYWFWPDQIGAESLTLVGVEGDSSFQWEGSRHWASGEPNVYTWYDLETFQAVEFGVSRDAYHGGTEFHLVGATLYDAGQTTLFDWLFSESGEPLHLIADERFVGEEPRQNHELTGGQLPWEGPGFRSNGGSLP